MEVKEIVRERTNVIEIKLLRNTVTELHNQMIDQNRTIDKLSDKIHNLEIDLMTKQ